METITIGTRGSKLALWQAHHVADCLRQAHAGLKVELEIIKTSGDRIQDRPLYEVGGKGLFIKEIEEALIDGRVDMAVHSMKDVPAGLPEGLVLGALMERANPYDALISRGGESLSALPEGAVVGTSSLRRQFQLLGLRPDLKIIPLRGNVDTRLEKLEQGRDGLQAIVLAVAGLERLGHGAVISERLVPPGVLPAIGQGALGLELRAGDARVQALLEPLRHRDTEDCVHAERGVLERLEGDCHLPIACHAWVDPDDASKLRVKARLGLPDASEVVEVETHGARDDARALGFELGSALLDQGGRALMDALG